MRVVFSKPAKQELDDAVRFYELAHPGLGKHFRREVRNAAKRIGAYPEAWSKESENARKCILHRFPYKLLYSVEEDVILIVAVAHLHRRPGYWVDRTDGEPDLH
jgi:plasmid stabilization system protein ParE